MFILLDYGDFFIRLFDDFLMIDIVQGRVIFRLLITARDDLELLHDINCNRAHITANKRHAALLIARDEERAAAAKAVAIMLAVHAIAAIHSAKHVTGQLRCYMLRDLMIDQLFALVLL